MPGRSMSRRGCLQAHEAHADMIGAEPALLELARGGAIARAVIARAQIGSTLDDMVALGPAGVAGPFPDIADHVVQAKIIGLEAADRCAAPIAVSPQIADREHTLIIIRLR